MFVRQDYLDRIISWRDTPELIKVVSGVRRCGKSSLFAMYGDYLREQGVPSESIVSINLENLDYSDIDSYQKLHDAVKGRKAKEGKTYVFLDEIQQINEWERAANSLRLDTDLDIYITGSNTQLLNSRLATLLSGRYVELRMLPLSFKEYLLFSGTKPDEKQAAFRQYLIQGGFPGIFSLKEPELQYRDYLSGIYSTIVMNDIIKINQVREMDIMEKVIRFLADNTANIVSPKKIADYIVSSGRKTSSDTTDNYLSMLENAYLFYRAKRDDIRGKSLLKTNDKFFIVDLGLRNLLAGKSGNFGSSLENLVYFELQRRGYQVSIGKLDSLEVDFIARKFNETVYYQVSASIADDAVRERELQPLRQIPDNYKKTLLTMDPVGDFNDIKGIFHYNIVDFLTEATVKTP